MISVPVPFRSSAARPFIFLMAGAFILLPSFASTSQSLLHDHFEDRAFQAVHEAGDLRDSKLIVSYFGRDDDLNVEVLSVLGSLQSQETIDTIIPFLRSSNVRVRLAAAWALAQTARIAPPRRFIDSVFTSCIESERSASAKQGFIALAGFCCGADAVIPLRRAVFGPDIVGLGTDTSMSAAWATAIARMAVHGIRTRVGIDDAAEIIRRAPFASMAARTAAQALARAGDSITLRQHTALLLEFAGNPEPDLRASMIEALGKLQIDTAGSAIVKAAVDTASIVRIAALRLLPTLRIATEAGRRYLLLALIRGITSRAYCIAKTALQSIARLSHSDMRLTLAVKRLMDTTRSIDLRNEALRTLAAQAPDLATAVIQNHQRAENPSPAALEAVGILGSTERRPMPEFRAWLTDNMLSPDANRASAAAAAVGVLWNIAVKNRQGSDAHDDSTYRAPFLRALTVHAELRHGGTVQTILEALLDPLHPTRTATAEMLNALQHFSSSDNVETVVALIDAVAHTGDSTAATALGAYLSDPHPAVRAAAARALHVAVPGQPHPIRSGPHHDWDLISAIARHPYAIMHTSRGNIRVRLFVVDAPFTIEAFARLAQEGFYNGLTFHRVVPNFVVQGGDPSGDGSGGPPFTLRSEFSMRTFRYGRLGLASAGKDTEGSQFFFMLADALHLDGRYTCLGDVVSGADVMDNLEIGDTINSIEVERASDGQLEGHHR